MEIILRDNGISEWLELADGVKLKIDYPNYEQDLILGALFVAVQQNKDEKQSELSHKYYSNLIKFCVKDWEGITNAATGEEIKCELKGNELHPDLMKILVSMPFVVFYWGNMIFEQISLKEVDKKKL